MDKTRLHQILSLAQRAVREAREQIGEQAWQGLETALLSGERPWHEAVLLPLGLAQEMVLRDPDLRARLDRLQVAPGDLERISDLNLQACDLAALLPWNLTKGAYVFDPDLFRSLVGAPLERLPVDLLTRLPEYAPLLVFPEPWQGGVGAWVHLDVDTRFAPAHLEFRAVLLGENGRRLPLLLDLTGATLEECIQGTQTETLLSQQLVGMEGVSFPAAAFDTVRGLLNLALYLASEEPDLSGRPRPLPGVGQRRKDKPPRVYPEPDPLRIEVGWRIGAALRRARQAEARGQGGAGKSPQPHIRRAHWHLYWTGEGSRKDPSKARPKVRWIEPTLVGADRLEGELPAVVRIVEEP
ncbi:conserved hypothetical protein (plasmid) [Allomeiothermus silvanus DSM 9946]|uniref:Uncharacterized protein n=1 Tax=Allomeiothermus silvanus (strain ATCC 700542 / DSM 9946 / NBRC 106475 / NCIMB 13440 / VI-R2) TaxID=526227 RepID=D7BJS6_ALLS1|nr:hypothetical protein [Allomeiothermus silvanus]ADH65432.1 conserved hypothetical protein [Allomeiothermus silvanus DSM 9946]